MQLAVYQCFVYPRVFPREHPWIHKMLRFSGFRARWQGAVLHVWQASVASVMRFDMVIRAKSIDRMEINQ